MSNDTFDMLVFWLLGVITGAFLALTVSILVAS